MYYKRNYAVSPRTIGGFIEDVFQNGWANDAVPASVPVNIHETDKSYELHVVAPGFKKEDFKLNIQDRNTLQVTGEQKAKEETAEPQEGKWIRSEFRAKSFKRSFTLNDKVDNTKIAAKYEDGVLVVTLPKKEVSEPATIEIAVN